jgi:hypothetical protein
MRTQLTLAALLATGVTVGCTTHQGYIVPVATAQREKVVFHDDASGDRGNIDAELANGEKCHGRFNTVADQVTRNWEDPNDIVSEDSQVGMAVLQCAPHHVVKCDFVRGWADQGSGQCFDNLGQKYSLNF